MSDVAQSWLDAVTQGSDLPGLHEARRQAAFAFTGAGLPHRRMEDWKYTDIRTRLHEALPAAGWFNVNSGGRTHGVGELKANTLGLYDIHGNVWEWVQDGWEPTYYGQFQEKPALDPSGPFSAASRRVVRGGNWNNPASDCRA